MQGTQAQCRPNTGQTVRRYGSIVAVALLCTGCSGHTLTGVTYRTQVGRSTGELFQQGVTAWQAGAEFRYEVKR